VFAEVSLRSAKHVAVLAAQEVRQDVRIKQGSVHRRCAKYPPPANAPGRTGTPGNRILELTRFGGRFRYAAFLPAFFTECISSNSIGLL
jgi:hypothetical protein